MKTRPPKEIADALPPPSADIIGNVYRRWFNLPRVEVYIRLNRRVICGHIVRTLELSNVEVDEDARGKGQFSRLLDGLAKLARQRGEVFLVENVVSDIVRGALLRRGFLDYQGNGANYVKMIFQSTNEGDL